MNTGRVLSIHLLHADVFMPHCNVLWEQSVMSSGCVCVCMLLYKCGYCNVCRSVCYMPTSLDNWLFWGQRCKFRIYRSKVKLSLLLSRLLSFWLRLSSFVAAFTYDNNQMINEIHTTAWDWCLHVQVVIVVATVACSCRRHVWQYGAVM